MSPKDAFLFGFAFGMVFGITILWISIALVANVRRSRRERRLADRDLADTLRRHGGNE